MTNSAAPAAPARVEHMPLITSGKNGGTRAVTMLHCSCRARLGHGMCGDVVANVPGSQGGERAAEHRFAEHLAEVDGVDARSPKITFTKAPGDHPSATYDVWNHGTHLGRVSRGWGASGDTRDWFHEESERFRSEPGHRVVVPWMKRQWAAEALMRAAGLPTD